MAEPGQQNKRILIIEDEMDMRFYLSTLVKTTGYTPVVARNGSEGLALASQSHPDLIILDVMMPEKGGALTYRELRRDNAFENVPVVILSGVAKQTFYHYLRMLNAKQAAEMPLPDAYVEKPPDAAHLQDTIERLLK